MKGLEISSWLENLLQVTSTTLTDEGYQSLEKLKYLLKSNPYEEHFCKNDLNCSLETVYYLRYWYVDYRKKL